MDAQLYIGTNVLQVKRVTYSKATAAAADVIAAVTGKKIRVVAMHIQSAAAETVLLRTGTSADVTGVMSLATGVPLVLPLNPAGWFETVAGEALRATHGSTNQVSGSICYVEV